MRRKEFDEKINRIALWVVIFCLWGLNAVKYNHWSQYAFVGVAIILTLEAARTAVYYFFNRRKP